MNKVDIYIGIDPSINSTGVTIMFVDTSTLRGLYTEFWIIKGNKLTKKEATVEKEIKNLRYAIYSKNDKLKDLDEYKREEAKATNLSNIADTIKRELDLLVDWFKANFDGTYIGDKYVCMEGISYGSIHSSAVMDLAGLNYLIRDRILSIYSMYGNLYVCPPAQIKMFATGLGNAKKEQMVESFVNIIPEMAKVPKNDDLADSYFMCRWMLNHNRVNINEGEEIGNEIDETPF